MNDPMIAIYARISLEGGDSVEHQVALLREVARTRGLGCCSREFIYEDVGVSATRYSIWTRPAMRRMLEDAKKNLFQIVMFKGISRFARSTQEALDVLDRLKSQGLRVISYEENYDSLKENSNFMFTMHAAIAEYEAEKTGIRVRLGNKAKTQGGRWCGAPPDGYRLVEGRLEIDLERRQVVEKIFELYTGGLGSFKVAQAMNRLGWTTSKGGLWCAKTVRDILRNQAYIGKAAYNRTRQFRVRDYASREEGRKKWVRVTNPREDWVVVDNAHPPIISGQVFARAQAVLSQRGGRQNTVRARHPLTGILFCGKCGQGMVCQKRTTVSGIYRYYICKTYHKYGREFCPQANINADDIEAEVMTRLRQKLGDKEFKERLTAGLTIDDDIDRQYEQELRMVRTAVDKVNRDTAELYFKRHQLTPEQFDYLAARLKSRAEVLVQQEKGIINSAGKHSDTDIIGEIKRYTEDFLLLQNASAINLRLLLPSLIDRIVWDGEILEISYMFNTHR